MDGQIDEQMNIQIHEFKPLFVKKNMFLFEKVNVFRPVLYMDGWSDGVMDGWSDGWMDGQIDGQMDR